MSATAVSALVLAGLSPAAFATDYSGLSVPTQMVSVAEEVPLSSIDPQARFQSFNNDWKFMLGDVAGAQGAAFNDASWRGVDLPHDYSIEQSFSQSMEAESGYLPGGVGWYRKSVELPAELEGKRINLNFDGIYMDATIYVNGVELANHPYGYTPFSVDITDALNFGANNVVAVKVNHQTPSSRWYSGSGIYRDVDLMIADPVHVPYSGVKVVAKNIDGYTGAGTLNLDVSTALTNESSTDKTFTLKHTVTPKAGGEAIGTVTKQVTLTAGATLTDTTELAANSPQLWSLRNPAQYVVRTELLDGSEAFDAVDTVTGFRKLTFDAGTGFALNGEKMKLKGVSMHHDQGALGAKAYKDAIERQIDILKDMGVNTIRITHNPGSRDLIDLANEKGVLIIEEIFDGLHCVKNTNSKDYARFFDQTVPAQTKLENVANGSTWARFDLETTLKRDVNAPSVIMWSLGNEIQEGTACAISSFSSRQADLISWAAGIDQTRPVTRGDNAIKRDLIARNVMSSLLSAATTAGTTGTVGANYADGGQYDMLHNTYPNAMLYGAETASSVNSRGVYSRTSDSGQTSDKQLTSYDGSKVNWGHYAAQAWLDVIKRDYVAGTAVWTGFDYIGEPTNWNGTRAGAVGSWPSPKNSYFGIVDTAGFPKDSFYLYQSQWNDDVHTLHILPAWNRSVLQNGGSGNQKIVVYSDARSVELFFTPTGGQERSLGKKTFTEKTTDAGYKYQIYEGEGKSSTEYENLYLSWNLAYEDGTLRAVAYDAQDRPIADTQGRSSVSTAGEAASLDVQVNKTTLRANNEDLAYYEVTVLDANGVPVPDADIPVTFTATGACEVVGTDNGEQADHTSYLSATRNTYHGKVLGIVKATKQSGSCSVTVSTPALPSVAEAVQSEASGETSADANVISYTYPRNYYVQVGTEPVLPAKIDANLSDGSTEAVDVTWDELTPEQYGTPGTFTVRGTTAKGHSVSVNVTMLNRAGAVLNYSATTQVGTVPTIPDTRPAVLPDGTILDAQFEVDWDLPEDNAYATAGTVVINGTATVLEDEFPVTATIRVQEPAMTIGSSVTGAANLTQDIPADKQSDTLNAIKDGSTALGANTGGGPNPTTWTNYANSQAGDNTAEIEFAYDTQQTFGEFNVYFYKDTFSARFPDAGTTKFYVKDNVGDEWQLLDVTETIASSESPANVKKYSYALNDAPVSATFVKLEVTNKNETLSNGKKPCTGITEVELKTASLSTSTYSTAQLESLTVNGEAVPETALANWTYSTPAEAVAQIEAATRENAAFTVLPEYEGVARVIVESEDHATTNTFTIRLGENQPAPADDASRDVAPESTNIAVGSQAATSGNNSKGSALDGRQDTVWHTPWGAGNPINGNTDNFATRGWAVLILDEPTDIEALRYQPRADGNNGTITGYKVYVSNTDDPQGETQDGVRLPADDQYTLVSQGTWADNSQWKLAQFDQVHTAKYVKLVPTSTVSDTRPNMFVSAAELRLREPKPQIDLNDPELGFTVSVQPETVEVESVDADHPARPSSVVVADKDGNILTAGVNYRLTYTADTQAGEAMVTVTGINTHKGELSATYMIALKPAPEDPEPIDISDPDNGYVLTVEPAEVKVDLVDADHPAVPTTITVTAPDGTALAQGVDFEVSYEGNTDEGEANVRVTGIGAYTGVLSAAYTITLNEPVVAPTEATAVEPTTEDPASCTVKPYVLIADTEGVQYLVNGEPVNAGRYEYAYGATVTVTAQAKDGYQLTNPDWSAEFTSPTWESLNCDTPDPGTDPGTDPEQPGEPGTDPGTEQPGTDPDPGTDPGTDPEQPGTDPEPEQPGSGTEQPGTGGAGASVDPGSGTNPSGDDSAAAASGDGEPVSPSIDTMPNTGAHTAWVILLSVALLASGAAIVAARRRQV